MVHAYDHEGSPGRQSFGAEQNLHGSVREVGSHLAFDFNSTNGTMLELVRALAARHLVATGHKHDLDLFVAAYDALQRVWFALFLLLCVLFVAG